MATDASTLIQAGLQTMTALAPSRKRRRKKKKAKMASSAVPVAENPKPVVPKWAWWALGLSAVAGVGGAVWWGVKRKKNAAALADAQMEDEGDGLTTNERVLALVNQFNRAAAAETEASDHARSTRVRKLMAAPRSNIGTTNSGNSGRLEDDIQVFKPTRGAVI